MFTTWFAAARGLILLPLVLSLMGCCGQFFKGPHDVVGVSVSPNGNTIKLGNTQQFSATATFQYYDGHTGDVTPQTEWTSSDPTIATIDATGLATAMAYGTVTIKGTCDCYTSKVTLTVGNQDISLTSIAISPSDKTVASGTTQQFTATASYSNSTTSDISGSVSWTSSDTSVATINTSGLATAVSSGTTTITASSGGISGNTTLTVASSPGS